jgi:predicted nucleic acid-binding protein
VDRLYLDSCILVSYFSSLEKESEKKELVKNRLNIFANLIDFQLCTSHWTLTETVNVLISNHKMNEGDVAKIESDFINKKRLGPLKIEILSMSKDKTYDFQELCYDVRLKILAHHAGVGDTLHSVIMSNNNVDKILTFDEKEDFKQIPGLKVFHPRDIANEREKIK